MDFKNTGLSSLGLLEFTTGEFTAYYISPLPHPQLCSLSHRQLWLTGATSWNEHPAEDPPSPRAASQVCLLLQLSNITHSKISNSVLSLEVAGYVLFLMFYFSTSPAVVTSFLEKLLPPKKGGEYCHKDNYLDNYCYQDIYLK